MWGQHDQEHVQVLLKYAKQHRELHQSTCFETEMYREWLAKESLKGHRGLFRSLKEGKASIHEAISTTPLTRTHGQQRQTMGRNLGHQR